MCSYTNTTVPLCMSPLQTLYNSKCEHKGIAITPLEEALFNYQQRVSILQTLTTLLGFRLFDSSSSHYEQSIHILYRQPFLLHLTDGFESSLSMCDWRFLLLLKRIDFLQTSKLVSFNFSTHTFESESLMRSNHLPHE